MRCLTMWLWNIDRMGRTGTVLVCREMLFLPQMYWVHTPTISFCISSGIPGIFQMPKNPDTLFARSIQRLIAGIHYAQERGAPITLGDNFPYEPRDLVHFLGPCGHIGQGYILSKSGKDYRVAHSGTRISSLSKDYISPTLRTRKSFSLKAALCPKLNTIKCRNNLKVRFQLGTKRAKSHKIK